MIDGTRPQPLHDFEAINNELLLFNPQLASKPQILAYNKVDVPEASEQWDAFLAGVEGKGVEVLQMSAVTGAGTLEVVRAAHRLLAQVPNEYDWEEEERGGDSGLGVAGIEFRVQGFNNASIACAVAAAVEREQRESVGEAMRARRNSELGQYHVSVDKHTRTFTVQGEGLERFCQMTNWE